MKTLTYTLPSYWASYLVNGDASGLEDAEIAEVDAFVKSEANDGLFSCADVSEETWFAHTNDASGVGGDVATFTFLVEDETPTRKEPTK